MSAFLKEEERKRFDRRLLLARDDLGLFAKWYAEDMAALLKLMPVTPEIDSEKE